MSETLFFPNESFSCPGGVPTVWENRWPIFEQLRGRFGTSLVGQFPSLHDAGPQPWPAPSAASGDLPAFGSNSADLEHHLSQRRDGSFWMRNLSIKSVGIEPRPWCCQCRVFRTA